MSRFPGAETLGLLLLTAAGAWADDGAAAFDRKDFAAAAELWRDEAAEGSADAMLGLGLIHDLGLGVARDSATAIRWYLEAAAYGEPDAQFNAAVMLDSGVGSVQEPAAAALWYSRASANGNARAQYNLGVLYETGAGVPQNADLARYWLGMAAPGIAAARERLDALPPAPEGRLQAPVPLGGAVVRDDAGRAELAWSAAPGPQDSRFQVDLVAGGAPLPSVVTEASAIAVEVPSVPDIFWRVARIDAAGARYAASDWQPLGDASRPPIGSVVLLVAEGDAPARRLAEELARTFRPAGLATAILPRYGGAQTAVSYAYAEDADLAGQVADFLPGLVMQDAELDEGSGAAGTIRVRLVGGPSAR